MLGVDVGDSEDEVFWRGFLRSLKARDWAVCAWSSPTNIPGSSPPSNAASRARRHQRCRVHFVRNLLALVPKSHQDMVAAVFRTIFAQPDPATVASTWDEVRDQLVARFPKIAPLMDDAKAEVLAFATYPRAHWTKSGRRMKESSPSRSGCGWSLVLPAGDEVLVGGLGLLEHRSFSLADVLQ